jgi:hypothetical protein
MIPRNALFQGDVSPGKPQDFRTAMMDKLLPTWLVYPGATAVPASFATERDDQAPNVPLILAVVFAPRERLDLVLYSQERLVSRTATQRALPGLFTGNIFHYVTASTEHRPD